MIFVTVVVVTATINVIRIHQNGPGYLASTASLEKTLTWMNLFSLVKKMKLMILSWQFANVCRCESETMNELTVGCFVMFILTVGMALNLLQCLHIICGC